MKRFIAVLLLAGFASTQALAQESSGGSLAGLVKNQEDRPVADVKVSAIDLRTNKQVAEVMTDSQGGFEFKDLPEGRYGLIFFSPYYERSIIRSVDIKKGREKRLKDPIRLEPAKQEAILNGAVFTSEGRLAPGARVTLERVPVQPDESISPLKREATTNSSGEFAFRLPGMVARYRVTASARGFDDQSVTVDIGGAERRRISIQLQPKS